MRSHRIAPRRAQLACRLGLLLAALWLPLAAAAGDTGSPHTSTDTAICSICHKDDMSLQSPKSKICLTCHNEAQHAGSAEHLRMEPARVGRALAATSSAEKLPLTDDGHIWCGTCHLWHDPSLGEGWLPKGWVPPDRGLPGAVRAGVTTRWAAIASAHDKKTIGAEFAKAGTRQLRLSYQDGSLCKRCHGDLP
jgi:hypothetical protein